MKDKIVYCGACKKDTLFRFLGYQETSGKNKLRLYNCTKCKSTRAF